MKFAGETYSPEREQRVRSRATVYWVTIIWLLGALIVFGGLRSVVSGGSQSSDIGDMAADQIAQGPAWARMGYDASRVLILATAGAAIAFFIPLNFKRGAGAGLFWFGVAGGMVSLVVSMLFTSNTVVRLALVDLPLLLGALWVLPVPRYEVVRRHVMAVLATIAFLSLAYLAISPATASSPYTGGMIPGLPIRLFGVAVHANTLGAAMGVYLIMDLVAPRRGFWVLLTRIAVSATLILSQSKTMVGVVIVVVLISSLMGHGKWPSRGRISRFLIGVVGAVVAVWTIVSDQTSVTDNISSGSFTGRNLIWDATFAVWQQYPYIGYGPNLWDLPMRLSYMGVLPNPPAHSHNQFLQVLAAYGLLGAVFFALLLIGIVLAARKGSVVSQGVSIALVLVLAGRSITEAIWFWESLPASLVTLLALLPILAAAAEPREGTELLTAQKFSTSTVTPRTKVSRH